MARNKYPEETVDKILNTAKKLFLEKGYDETTIQDIVDELGGLTKGAIYHHFKSKEDIMDALGDKIFLEDNPFTYVAKRTDLNGIEKIRELTIYPFIDSTRSELNRQSIPIMKNPRILTQTIEINRTLLTPLLEELIEEGNRDGSINTEYAKELSEALQLLTNLWLATSVYPGTSEALKRRLDFIKYMTDSFGVPIFTDEVMKVCKDFIATIGTDKN